jgi:hypothetical protein
MEIVHPNTPQHADHGFLGGPEVWQHSSLETCEGSCLSSSPGLHSRGRVLGCDSMFFQYLDVLGGILKG